MSWNGKWVGLKWKGALLHGRMRRRRRRRQPADTAGEPQLPSPQTLTPTRPTYWFPQPNALALIPIFIDLALNASYMRMYHVRLIRCKHWFCRRWQQPSMTICNCSYRQYSMLIPPQYAHSSSAFSNEHTHICRGWAWAHIQKPKWINGGRTAWQSTVLSLFLSLCLSRYYTCASPPIIASHQHRSITHMIMCLIIDGNQALFLDGVQC